MTYTVALVGAGSMGRVHANHWSRMPDVRLAAIVAETDANAPRLAQSLPSGVAVYQDFDAMLAAVNPDIVDICTPTPNHREFVERAAAAGKAIFVEKPLARTMADCDAIVALVERTGVPLMVGHVVRWFPEYARTTQMVKNGAVGTPAAVRTARTGGMPGLGRPYNWFADPAKSGGVILDLIIHDIDWLRWTFGPVTRVFAKGLTGRPEYDGLLDYALVTLRHESGVVSHVTGSWAHVAGFRTTLEVAGDAGLIEHDSARTAPLTVARRAGSAAGASGAVAIPESPLIPDEDPYFQELRAFVTALKTGAPPPVTAADARESARIGLAALESIETGKVVTLG
jgi:UDP-N-acetylglucosamine 3-dehydrogenase